MLRWLRLPCRYGTSLPPDCAQQANISTTLGQMHNDNIHNFFHQHVSLLIIRLSSVAIQQSAKVSLKTSKLGYVELATEPILLLHREHGTGYQRCWNCCDQQTRFVVILKHFCFILSMGTRIRIDSVKCPRSSSRGRNISASVTVTVTVTRNARQNNETTHCQ